MGFDNYDADTLRFVVLNRGKKDFPLEPDEAWQFIVPVDDALDAFNHLKKVKIEAKRFGHVILNIYLDDMSFNPGSWYTGGVNPDAEEYNDKVKISNTIDHTKYRQKNNSQKNKRATNLNSSKNQSPAEYGKQSPRISVRLTDHARLDCLPLRFGVIYTDKLMSFDGVVDEIATNKQKPKEIRNGNEHFVGTLYDAHGGSLENVRLVLARAEGASNTRSVITVMLKEQGLSTRAVSDLVRALRMENKITPEQIANVIHPLYKQKKISTETDFFEALVNFGVEHRKNIDAKAAPKSGADITKKASAHTSVSNNTVSVASEKIREKSPLNNKVEKVENQKQFISEKKARPKKENRSIGRLITVLMFAIFAFVFVNREAVNDIFVISSVDFEPSNAKPIERKSSDKEAVEQQVGWKSTSNCTASLDVNGIKIRGMHLSKFDGGLVSLVLSLNEPELSSQGYISVDANVGESFRLKYEKSDDKRKLFTNFTLYINYLAKANYIQLDIDGKYRERIDLPSNSRQIIERIKSC